MPISYQEPSELTCPGCGAEFSAAVWLVLDAQEQPEELELLRRGELNQVRCPSCGAGGPAGAPLLFHDGQARRVIFAPAPGAAEHEWREQARDLHALLVGSIPEEQRRPYLADVDITQDLDGVAHLLRRLDSRRRGPAAPQGRASPPADPAEPGEEPPALLAAVEALLAADTPADLRRVVAEHPALADPATGATLAQLAEVAREQRAPAIAESLLAARDLLARMGGPAPGEPLAAPGPAELPLAALLAPEADPAALVAAHPELLGPAADDQLAARVEQALEEGNERLAALIEARREALAELRLAAAPPASLDEAIEALLVADGEDAMAEVIDRYPLLLEDVAAEALWQFAAEARASGDEDLARYAVECRELLRRIRDAL